MTSAMCVALLVAGSWQAAGRLPEPMSPRVAEAGGALVAVGEGDFGARKPGVVYKYERAGKTWVRQADMPSIRRDFALVALDDRIYAVGGMAGADENSALLESFDPRTNSWKRHADLPIARSAISAVALGGRLWTVGGFGAPDTGVAAVEAYDPREDKWQKQAEMPTRRGYVSLAVIGSRLLAIGGYDRAIVRAVEELDPATGRWTRLAPYSGSGAAGPAMVVKGRVYIIPSWNSPTANVEEFDPASGAWAIKAAMPTLRGDFGHVVVGDRIYALGGWRRGGRDLVPSVERYDPGSDAWSQLPPLSEPKWQFATVYYEGRILVIGGLLTEWRQPRKETAVVEALDPGR